MSKEITRIGVGARMSEAVCYNGIVWVAGQVGKPGDSVADQTRTCLAEVDRILAAAGTDKTRILSTQIWLADIATFGESDYNQKDAEGFINLFGLPTKVNALVQAKNKKKFKIF